MKAAYENRRVIKVLIASPGDLAVERQAFREQIDKLNDGFTDGAEVVFEPLGWEDTLSGFGRRVQSIINAHINACTIFRYIRLEIAASMA